ncbi:hypothetical protein QBC37DRAFT_478317 [Rhypophila decipiens]|uniref:Uncharacterized protein n=1 Tax=Rhypophila decipiens TaxID=261697 RepID=A0AAN6YI38_9PEZI|nr:hypothetical protein QBC37DRAFT_478317 [Rhypophila decipiens]
MTENHHRRRRQSGGFLVRKVQQTAMLHVHVPSTCLSCGCVCVSLYAVVIPPRGLKAGDFLSQVYKEPDSKRMMMDIVKALLSQSPGLPSRISRQATPEHRRSPVGEPATRRAELAYPPSVGSFLPLSQVLSQRKFIRLGLLEKELLAGQRKGIIITRKFTEKLLRDTSRCRGETPPRSRLEVTTPYPNTIPATKRAVALSLKLERDGISVITRTETPRATAAEMLLNRSPMRPLRAVGRPSLSTGLFGYTIPRVYRVHANQWVVQKRSPATYDIRPRSGEPEKQTSSDAATWPFLRRAKTESSMSPKSWRQRGNWPGSWPSLVLSGVPCMAAISPRKFSSWSTGLVTLTSVVNCRVGNQCNRRPPEVLVDDENSSYGEIGQHFQIVYHWFSWNLCLPVLRRSTSSVSIGGWRQIPVLSIEEHSASLPYRGFSNEGPGTDNRENQGMANDQ